VWTADTGKEIAHLTSGVDIRLAAFSPDGKYIVSDGCNQYDESYICIDGSARVWSVDNGQEVVHMMHDGQASYATFSPDGKYVLAFVCVKRDIRHICTDGSARVWAADTGQEIAHLTHNGDVMLAVFSPDGKYVVSGGCDQYEVSGVCSGLCHVWAIDVEKKFPA
jgi:Tol biopolymer transport system component